jgi:prepilin-type N-terminal cleavage/methylation domain-containing protein
MRTPLMQRRIVGRPACALRLEPQRSARRGMTLIEVMVSMTIVTSALLGFGLFIARFQHITSQADAASAAMDLAVSQVELIKAEPTYDSLTSFNGTSSGPFANCPGCTMTTKVVKDSNANNNYTTVSVTVSVPALSSSFTAAAVSVPFEKTTVIAAP